MDAALSLMDGFFQLIYTLVLLPAAMPDSLVQRVAFAAHEGSHLIQFGRCLSARSGRCSRHQGFFRPFGNPGTTGSTWPCAR